jgi:Tol biopolymer transport system component
VKVLDFGLAAVMHAPGASAAADLTDSPTLIISPTRAGTILGTAAYMSPEQAGGSPVDKRADIWAFGAVLYEMLTGKAAFAGETIAEILASVMKEQPNLTVLPAQVRTAVERCLSKDQRKRWGSIGDVRWALETGQGIEAHTARRRARRQWPAIAATALLGVAALLYVFRTSSPPLQTMHQQITFVGDAAYPAISPDGKLVAYVAGIGPQQRRLMLQDVKGGQAIELAKTALCGLSLLVAGWASTCVRPYARTKLQDYRQGDWRGQGNTSDRLSLALRSRLVASVQHVGGIDRAGERSPVADGLYYLHGPSTGSQTQTISKIAIDPKSGDARGQPVALLTGLQASEQFTLSADGTRPAYIRAPAHSNNLWLADVGNPHGKEVPAKPLTSGTSRFRSLSISPDGKWLACFKGQFLFKMPMDGSAPIRLTFSDAIHFGTAWSPDGRWIAFGAHEGETTTVWIVDAEGGNPRQLVKTKMTNDLESSIAWWPGVEILYQKPGNRNFAMLDPQTGEEKPLIQDDSAGWVFWPKHAPDGKRVAAAWLRPPGFGLWLISLIDHSVGMLHAGWLLPAGWSPDGKLLYAFAIPGYGHQHHVPQHHRIDTRGRRRPPDRCDASRKNR